MNPGFNMWPHRFQVLEVITGPAGPTGADTNQDAIALLGHLGTMLGEGTCGWTVPGATSSNN